MHTNTFDDKRTIGGKDEYTALGYYGETPESPNGRLIAYTRFLRIPASRGEIIPAELWVCDRAAKTARRKIVDVPVANTHNGVSAQWLDDHHLVYECEPSRRVQAVNIDTGTHLLAEPVAGEAGHATFGGRFLVTRHGASAAENGILECDPFSGKVRMICSIENLLPAMATHRAAWWAPPDLWTTCHGQYCDDGSLVSLRVTVANEKTMVAHDLPQGLKQMLVTCRIDGNGSDAVCFGTKPMHFLWYDENTLLGHDNQVDDGQPDDRSMRRWTRQGDFIETLAGPGCHGALSPDKQWVASESWYSENPVLLRLFRTGDTTATAVLMQTSHVHSTWVLANHVNPSFSRDSRRVYFNAPRADGSCCIAFAEVDSAGGTFHKGE